MNFDTSGLNTQISAYMNTPENSLKQHQRELLKLIKDNYPIAPQNWLDIGCADGQLGRELGLFWPQSQGRGVDTSGHLIGLAKKRGVDNVDFEVADAASLTPVGNGYDLVIASGILSIWEDFRVPLASWLSLLNQNGQLYVFGRFNSDPVDVIVRFRLKHQDWEGGLTSYSVESIREYLGPLGFKCEFTPFALESDLEKTHDPVKTYTVMLVTGERLVLNGANTVAEHYFARIWRDEI